MSTELHVQYMLIIHKIKQQYGHDVSKQVTISTCTVGGPKDTFHQSHPPQLKNSVHYAEWKEGQISLF